MQLKHVPFTADVLASTHDGNKTIISYSGIKFSGQNFDVDAAGVINFNNCSGMTIKTTIHDGTQTTQIDNVDISIDGDLSLQFVMSSANGSERRLGKLYAFNGTSVPSGYYQLYIK